jgi:hypothetical protein
LRRHPRGASPHDRVRDALRVREGEQFNLELPDLVVGSDPHVVVRFGAKGEPPKNGKIRRLPLTGELLAVCARWLEALPTYAPKNRDRLVFPLPSGARVQPGKHRSTRA